MGNIATIANQAICVFNDPKIGAQFSSFSPEEMAGKIKLYNAINSPDNRLADFINTPIVIRDVVVSKVQLAEKMDKNGEASPWESEDGNGAKTRDGFRVVIIDPDDKAYTATSTGIYNSICTLRSIFGTLHFEDGLKAVVKQVKTKNGNTLTLSLTD